MTGTHDNAIRFHEEDGTTLKVFQDTHDRFKTTVARLEKLESNTLYHGYDEDEAINVFEECLERFDIGDVESLDEIQWEAPRN